MRESQATLQVEEAAPRVCNPIDEDDKGQVEPCMSLADIINGNFMLEFEESQLH